MEENKFEKQVQQKMNELQIQPSEAVWKKIELQIEKKKERKWGLIILFLCSVIILSGGYWLWNGEKQKVVENSRSEKSMLEKNSNSSATIKEDTIVQQQIHSTSESANRKNNDVAKDEEKRKAKENTLFNNSKANQPFNLDDKSATTFSIKKKIKDKTDGKTEMQISSAETSQKQTVNENTINDSLNKNYKEISVDSLSKPVVLDETIKHEDTSKHQQAIIETIKHSNKKRWKFGLLFASGVSGAGKDVFSLTYPAASYNSGNLNSGGPQQQGFSSSATKAGFGFIAGVSAEKNISKKIEFASGINFKSFSTSFKLYDSAGTYSARIAANKYINHFNFIEVPLSLKFQLGNGKHLPLSWQAGISISELISSNALQLNSSTGYYYKDNSLLNKTQVGFNTAFLLTLFSKQKNSILIGPYFYYDASKIANEGLYDKKHFVFTGLHTQIIFGK